MSSSSERLVLSCLCNLFFAIVNCKHVVQKFKKWTETENRPASESSGAQVPTRFAENPPEIVNVSTSLPVVISVYIIYIYIYLERERQ